MSDKIFRKLHIVLFVIVLIVFLFSLYKVVTITMEYRAGREAYNELESFVQLPSEEDLPVRAETSEVTSEPVTATKTTEEAMEIQYHDGFVNLTVDFASLEAINSDFEGWLYIPALSINYPVVLGTDNDYYLTHTFQKGENKAGSLFLDQVTTNPFENYNTIIHGHDMKDGSMFGKLDTFYRDTQTYADNPYFYVYTADKTYKYLIFSYYVTHSTSDTYQIPGSEETYQEYKDYLEQNAVWRDVEGVPESAPIVTLSTCYGDQYTELRFVVHGILVDTQ